MRNEVSRALTLVFALVFLALTTWIARPEAKPKPASASVAKFTQR